MKRFLAPAGTVLFFALYFGFSAAADRGVSKRVEGIAGIAYMLGPLRPVFVDLLWLSAIEAQDTGRYYEAHDIALYTAELQPHFDEVWQFIAWNLTYNISWDHGAPEDRFYWIREGIRLLEDNGLKNNPNSFLIHTEIAHTYHHRLSRLGLDPYLDYFQEYLSPPAGWLKNQGFFYRGGRLLLSAGELRLYETEKTLGGEVSFGPFDGPACNRPELPFVVFWHPAEPYPADDIEKVRPGLRLFGPEGRDVVSSPKVLEGAFVLPLGLEDCRRGARISLPAKGRLVLGFLPDRLECFRQAVKWFRSALETPDAKGLAALNVRRSLAHAYTSIGQFDEAESAWREALQRHPRYRESIAEAAANFYGLVINFYQNEPDRQLEWFHRAEQTYQQMCDMAENDEKTAIAAARGRAAVRESMGSYEQAEKMWLLTLENHPAYKAKLQKDVRNFYYRVIYHLRREPLRRQEWFQRLKKVLPEETLDEQGIVDTMERFFGEQREEP